MRLPAVLVSLVVVELLAGAGLGAYAVVRERAPVTEHTRTHTAVERSDVVRSGIAGQVREACRSAARDRLRDRAKVTFRGERVLPGDRSGEYVLTGLVDAATRTGRSSYRPYLCSATREASGSWFAAAYLA